MYLSFWRYINFCLSHKKNFFLLEKQRKILSVVTKSNMWQILVKKFFILPIFRQMLLQFVIPFYSFLAIFGKNDNFFTFYDQKREQALFTFLVIKSEKIVIFSKNCQKWIENFQEMCFHTLIMFVGGPWHGLTTRKSTLNKNGNIPAVLLLPTVII